jgi:hypothetical protein
VSRLLVLVTGTGRSGTSTISGSLHHLGLHVPGPYLGANKSNPKGFYESTWAVDFHKKITKRARVNDFDGQPDALDRVRAAITPEMKGELATWLSEHSDGADQVVVKDPRSVWAQRLWRDAAREAGLEIRYLSMLRHPAEVIGSRATYYASKTDESRRRRYEVCSVGRWVNGSLISERETRGTPRTFVPYTDLLDDWRSVIRRVRDELGLTLNTDLNPDEHHPVDDFVDPDLRRVRVTWDELSVPGELESTAQAVWDELMVLCAHGAADADTQGRLDALADRYRQTYEDAQAIALDATATAVEEARRRGVRTATQRAATVTRDLPLEERPLRDISGRELLQAAGRRLTGRLRRR